MMLEERKEISNHRMERERENIWKTVMFGAENLSQGESCGGLEVNDGEIQ